MFNFDFIVFPNPTPMYTTKDFDIKYVAVQNKNQDTKEKTRQVPYVIFEHPSRQTSTYLIYFHGNAEDLQYASEFVLNLQQCLNVNCVVIEYPGYGVYTGYSPSEQLIFEDSLQLYDKIKQLQTKNSNHQNQGNNENCYNQGEQKNNKQKDSDESDDIIIFGRSIGSGPAIYLASQRKCKLLITMSAYQSIKQIGKDKVGFLSAFLKDKFNNFDRIRDIKCPALLIHGFKDTLIHYTHTQQLFNNINPEFKMKSGIFFPQNMTHNDYNYFQDLIDPIIEHCLKLNINLEDSTSHIQIQQQEQQKLNQLWKAGQILYQQSQKQEQQQLAQNQLTEQNLENYWQQQQKQEYQEQSQQIQQQQQQLKDVKNQLSYGN